MIQTDLTPLSMRDSTSTAGALWPHVSSPAVASIRSKYVQVYDDCYYHGFTATFQPRSGQDPSGTNLIITAYQSSFPATAFNRTFGQDFNVLSILKMWAPLENNVAPQPCGTNPETVTVMLPKSQRVFIPRDTIILPMIGGENYVVAFPTSGDRMMCTIFVDFFHHVRGK